MMSRLKSAAAVGCVAVGSVLVACGTREQTEGASKPIQIRAGIDHSTWDRLLGTYVDGQGRVAYRRWKANAADRESLKRYLRDLAAAPTPPAEGDDRGASLVNAYNALTVSWVLENLPTDSIRSLPDSFTALRHTLGGENVSLDAIEKAALLPQFGYRIHAVVSCASRSCPPLDDDAMTARDFDVALDAGMRRWLARSDLNRFLPREKKVEISQVFRWYAKDFQRAGGIPRVLAAYAPARYRDFLATGDYGIEYLDYNWGLNDQEGRGARYGGFALLRDAIRDRLR